MTSASINMRKSISIFAVSVIVLITLDVTYGCCQKIFVWSSVEEGNTMRKVQRDLFNNTYINYIKVAASKDDQASFRQAREHGGHDHGLSEKKPLFKNVFPYYWVSNDTDHRFAIWHV